MLQPRDFDTAYVARILTAFPTQHLDDNDYFADNGHLPGSFARDTPGLAEPLTPREMDVLTLLARRLSNREIAAKLVVSAGTVKTHTLNIYAKLDVHSRTHAVKKAKELGLLTSG